MPNHFHLLLEINTLEELRSVIKYVEVNEAENKISKCFSNFFSSYTQAYNKLNDRMGNLFMSSFKKKLVESTSDYCNVIHYIHANPVHHGYLKNIED